MATEEDESSSILTADEYNVQYFGFSPQTFMNGKSPLRPELPKRTINLRNGDLYNLKVDLQKLLLLDILKEHLLKCSLETNRGLEVYNAILEYLHEGISALNDTILNMFAEKISEAELKEMSCKQGQLAVKRLDAHFEKAELYLGKNVFRVPDHIVLPEDKMQLYLGKNVFRVPDHIVLPEDKVPVESPFSVEEMAALDQDIQTVMDKLLAAKYANASLVERISQIETLQTQFDTTLKTLQTTHSDVSAQSKSFMQTADDLSHVNRLLDSVKLD